MFSSPVDSKRATYGPGLREGIKCFCGAGDYETKLKWACGKVS